jgi:hypothetical protein
MATTMTRMATVLLVARLRLACSKEPYSLAPAAPPDAPR